MITQPIRDACTKLDAVDGIMTSVVQYDMTKSIVPRKGVNISPHHYYLSVYEAW